jgi:hypothetical protein
MAFLTQSLPVRSRRRGPLSWLSLLLLGWLAVTAPTAVRAETDPAEVKAAFAYRFTLYTEWPTNQFGGAQSPIVIGVLGDAPLGEFLEKIVAGRLSQGRSVVVRRCSRVEDLAGCHVAFLRQSDRRRQLEILGALRGKPVLTVCDTDAFFGLGVTIKLFIRADNSVGFWVNRLIAEQSGIKIGSRMLQCADEIRATPPVLK